MTSTRNRRQVIPKPRPPIDWKEARRLYLKERLTYAQVALRMGRSKGGIRTVLVAHGVPRHPLSPATTGKWGKTLYSVWSLMKAKCRDRTYQSYRHYGAQGIDFCPEWERFEPFYRWAMESGYRPGKPLALRDGARLFSPRSCRWAPAQERVKLRLRLAPPTPWRMITAFGETKGVMAWVRDPRCRVRRRTVCLRIDRGYTPEDAISLPGNATRYDAIRRRIRRRRGHGPVKRKSVIDWPRAVKLYVLRGMSPPRIARVLGVSYPGVLLGLKRLGLYRPRERRLRDARLCTTLHGIWFWIHERFRRSHLPDYASYGAKGARVCREWSTFAPFYRWALGSGYRRGLRLTRRNRKAGFSPKNCAWISKTEASRLADHAPRVPKPGWMLQAFGETKGAAEWSRDRRCSVTLPGLLQRLRSGMAPEEAITKPPRSTRREGRYRYITAFGETKSLTGWHRDHRCRVSIPALSRRLSRGIAAEVAIRTPPYDLQDGKLPEPRPRRKVRRGKRHGS